MIPLAIVAFAAATVQPGAAPQHSASPVAVQWDTFNFSGPESQPKPGELAATAAPATILEAILRAGGLLGGGRAGASSSLGWTVAPTGLTFGRLAEGAPEKLQSSADLPPGWLALDASTKESAGTVLTVNLNALRANSDRLFDAWWVQRTLDRLALDNARLVSLRATLHPAAADKLPPMLEVKAIASARSVPPGPAKPVTLVAPGWAGSSTDAAAVTGARWAASLRFDSGGLGMIGRDGGSGTIAGLLRLCVDLVGAANSADGTAWSRTYESWQERSSDALRSLSTRLQQRGTLGCYGSAAAPDLVLVVQARRGERADTLTKAVEQISALGGLTSANGIWTLKDAGPLTPRLSATVCDTGAGPYLVVAVEHNAEHALLQQTAARLRLAK